MMSIQQPQNTMEAVTLGLFLSITATTDQQSKQIAEMVESMAGGLSHDEMEEAKAEALKMAQENWDPEAEAVA